MPCTSEILQSMSWFVIIDTIAKRVMLCIYSVKTLHTTWDLSSRRSCKLWRWNKKTIQFLEATSVNFLNEFKLKSWQKSKVRERTWRNLVYKQNGSIPDVHFSTSLKEPTLWSEHRWESYICSSLSLSFYLSSLEWDKQCF